MATKLNKNVTRETEVIKDNKPVYATMTETQRIELRLKSERQSVEIPISDLYDQLTAAPVPGKPMSTGNASFDDFIKCLKINAHIMDVSQRELTTLHDLLTRTFDDVGIAPTMLQKIN